MTRVAQVRGDDSGFGLDTGSARDGVATIAGRSDLKISQFVDQRPRDSAEEAEDAPRCLFKDIEGATAKVQTLRKLSREADAELVKLLLEVQTKLPDEIQLAQLDGIEKLPPELLERFMDFLALPDLEQRARNSQSYWYTAEAISREIEEEDIRRLSPQAR